MALNALTLSTTSGVQGRSFESTINGLTTGEVEVLVDGTPGFSTVNGRVSHPGLLYLVNTVVLREREPGVGSGFRDTRIDVTAYSIDHPAPQSPPDGTATVTDGQTVSVTDSTGSSAHPGTASVEGNTLDGVALPATAAMVDNGAAATLFLSSGFNAGSGTVGVTEGHLTGVTLPAGTGVVSDGQNVIISKADNTGLLATGVAHVDANDVFENVAMPSNHAVLADSDDSQILNNYDDSAGGAMQINVVANAPTFKLFNAVQRVATHMAPIQVIAGSKTVGASIAIDQGVYQPFPLGNPTDAIVQNGDTVAVRDSAGGDSHNATAVVAANAVTGVNLAATVAMVDQGQVIGISNVAGNDGVDGTATVTAGVAAARLPASNAILANGVGEQVPVTGTYTNTITPTIANGVITGFVLS